MLAGIHSFGMVLAMVQSLIAINIWQDTIGLITSNVKQLILHHMVQKRMKGKSVRQKTFKARLTGSVIGLISDVKNMQETLALILFSGGTLAMVQS